MGDETFEFTITRTFKVEHVEEEKKYGGEEWGRAWLVTFNGRPPKDCIDLMAETAREAVSIMYKVPIERLKAGPSECVGVLVIVTME